MIKRLMGVVAMWCSMSVAAQARADITLVFDSDWIAGGAYTDITAGNTASGVLSGLVFDLEFATNGWTAAGDGGLCFMPSGATYGSYNIHCGGANLGDFPASWDLFGVPGNYTHYENMSANPAVIAGDKLIWINGWSSSMDSRWYGTVTLVGLEYDDPGACCHEYWGNGPICEMLSQHVCGDYQGTFYGPNVPCSNAQVECDEAGPGACCYDKSGVGTTCTMLHYIQCVTLPNSYWYGPGVPCSDPQVECGTPVEKDGACCYTDPDLGWICTIATQAPCLSLPDGYWYGAGTSCGDPQVECDLPGGDAGACCYTDADLGWICTIATQADCLSLPDGYWYGAGTSCSDPQVECDLPGGDTGACCYTDADLGWICTITTQADCLSLPDGYWYGVGTSCSDPQVECDLPGGDTGACCYTDADLGWICTIATQADCLSLPDGYWYGAGTSCSDPQVECDLPGGDTGACCYTDADLGWICTITTQAPCLSLPNGYWYGAGTSCGDPQVECDLPGGDTGACCYTDPDLGWICTIATQADCLSLPNGYWYGAGTSCSDPQVECDLPGGDTGACCYTDADLGWICTITTQAPCLSLPNGYWYGAGTSCSDPQVECDLPGGDTGACCYTENCESHCDVMTEAQCQEYWGSTYFPGETCDEISCPPPSEKVGACCFNSGGVPLCEITTIWACEEMNGTFYGGIPCECVDCDTSTAHGACCYNDTPNSWACNEYTQSDCLTLANATWYGAGTVCSDPIVECDVSGGDECDVEPGANCAGGPMYVDAAYASVFGDGSVAVQTASPGIPGGSVVMVFDLTDINSAPLNSWFALNRYAGPEWNQNELGSIYGLAVNGDGDIFVTTTRSWNIDLIGSGGPGAVYRIDHITGQVSFFSNLPNTGSCLGNITWDCAHDQFFVSNMEDGKIYRLDAGGLILGTLDPAAPWSGVPGPVALGDRPWAVEVHAGRLYFSMWNEHYGAGATGTANEIWSVELDATGQPVGVEVLEVTLPSFSNTNWSSPVADMRFSPTGSMLLAERTMHSFDMIQAHQSRVLEYVCADGTWVPSGNTFGLGVSTGTNGSGGVDAALDRVWASADALYLNAPPPHENIYGFAGLPSTGGTITNSIIIDYQDNTTLQDKTLIGDLVVTAPVAPCPGDLDGNGVVDVDDLMEVLGGWLGPGGDADGDGDTDIDDMLLVIAAWGPC